MTKIDLITGFLGAGKTTFIKKYGDFLKRKNIKFAIVENEFGAPGVDSAILKSKSWNVTEIAGGCICCTLKTGFHEIIKDLCQTCDRIILEPSGIFNGDDFFDIMKSPDLKDICRVGMCITIVDPHSLGRLNESERTVLASEIADTGCILWSKMDILPQVDVNQAKADIRDIVSIIGIDEDIPYFPTASHMLKDEDFENLMKIGPIHRMHTRTFTDHTMIFQSTRIYPDGIYTVESIESCIEHMTSNEEYGEISRIKGFVKSQNGTIAVNCTASDRLFDSFEGDYVMLNIIGRKLNRKKIAECLNDYTKEKFEGIKT